MNLHAFLFQTKKNPIFIIRAKQLLGIHKRNAININTVGGRGKGKKTRELFHSNYVP